MSKRIIALCDNANAHEGHEVEGAEVVLALGPRGKPTALDLCDVCRKELVEPLEFLLSEFGQSIEAPVKAKAQRAWSDPALAGAPTGDGGAKVGRPRITVEGYEFGNEALCWCPVPGCDFGPVRRARLRDHTKVGDPGHGELLSILEGIHGARVEVDKWITLPLGCPSCRGRFASAQGLGQHTRAEHPGT